MRVLSAPCLQDDAQATAVEASGRSPSPLPPVNASSAASPDLVRLLHQRRTQLVERETALQRWVVALELEAARQGAAAKQLAAQEAKVARLASEAGEGRSSAQALLAEVAVREEALQRQAAALEQQHGALQAEQEVQAAERASLEGAAAELAARAGAIGRREAALAASEEQWDGKVQAAEAQLKVGCASC